MDQPRPILVKIWSHFDLETLCVACLLSKEYQDNIYHYLKMENNQVIPLLFMFPSKEKRTVQKIYFVFFSVLFLFLAVGFIQQRSKFSIYFPAQSSKDMEFTLSITFEHKT